MADKLLNKKTVYYITTLFIAVLVGFVGGLVDILQTEAVIDASNHLGYPLYFFFLLGIFKILGGLALTKIRDAAYLGFAFDFIFASFSHYSVGDGVGKIALPLILLGVLALSYVLKDRLN